MNNIHILFEQSGTFKNEFKKLGYNAISYDIENRFNETDYQVDLFNEIDLAINNKQSIFDDISNKDLILAFFPCTHFSGQNNLIYNKTFKAFKNWDNEKIEKYIETRKKQRNYFLDKLGDLITICLKNKIPLVIENPYTNSYLLNIYGYHSPNLIINNRVKLGDYKIEKHNQTSKGIKRSLITKEFANNFIRKHIFEVTK